MILRDIINSIESVAPLSYQEHWDNSGLQVGNPGTDIEAVLLTTDVTESVVAEAIARGCNLIVSHHPLLFRGLKQVCGQSPEARCVETAIRHNIAIYSTHTAIDSYLHGVSGEMARLLGLSDYRILVPAAPGADYGLGVVGELAEPVAYTELLERIRTTFGARYVRYTRSNKEKVQRIAMCGGSGVEFMQAAIDAGADVYLTADCKYHEFQSALDRIALVDIDHWASEHAVRDVLARLIGEQVPCYIAEADESPILVL